MSETPAGPGVFCHIYSPRTPTPNQIHLSSLQPRLICANIVTCRTCLTVWERIKKGLSSAFGFLRKGGAFAPFVALAAPYADKLPGLKHVLENWTKDTEFGRQVRTGLGGFTFDSTFPFSEEGRNVGTELRYLWLVD